MQRGLGVVVKIEILLRLNSSGITNHASLSPSCTLGIQQCCPVIKTVLSRCFLGSNRFSICVLIPKIGLPVTK